MKNSKNILIVDDDIVILKLFEKTISSIGYPCNCFTNGQKAMLNAKKSIPSLAIIDYQLHEMTAIEIIKFFKKFNILESIPLIIVTGHRELSLKKELKKLGVNEIITKPFSPSSLTNTVKKLIKK